MILNSKSNQFTIWFPKNFFYPEINKRWTPIVRRLKLPYESLEDFFNASIQSITMPPIDLVPITQQQGQFPIAYRPGKELEPLFEKTINVTFKLTEGFISYWLMFEQMEMFLKYMESSPFWPPMYVSFLDLHGFELVVFEFHQITPLSLTQFEVSYAQTAAEFNTFSVGLKYNRFKIKRRIDDQMYDVTDQT